MTDIVDHILKVRLAREIAERCYSLHFGVLPWLTLHFDYLEAVRRAHELTVGQLAEVLLDIAYLWRDGAALTRSRLVSLIEKAATVRSAVRAEAAD